MVADDTDVGGRPAEGCEAVRDERGGQVPAAGTGRDPDGPRGRVDLDRPHPPGAHQHPVGRDADAVAGGLDPDREPGVGRVPDGGDHVGAVRAPTTSRGRWVTIRL